MFSFSKLTSSVTSLASSVQASVTALVQEQKQKLAQEQAKLEETKQQQEAAEQAKQRGAYPLWTIYNEDQQILEAELKERILRLATDVKTWQIPDPPREHFPATMEFMLPFVVEALKHDKNLERAQYRLVPRKMSEEKFWRLYMYHVERYRAEMQVGSLFTPPKHFRLSEPIAALALARPVPTSTPSKSSTSLELSSMLSVEEPHASDSDYVSDEYVKVANRKLAAAAAAAASSSSSSSSSTSASSSSSSTSTSTSSSTSSTTTSTTSTQSTRIRTDDDDLEELESMLADVDVSNTDILSGDTNLHDLNDLVIEEELP